MRTVLHIDLNNCFASIESISHPEYKKIPFAVGGDEEMRHGIILAKNDIAKKFGIKTGESLYSARKKCPELKIVKPNFELYNDCCSAVRNLYCDYTDQVEPFGIDECWLDTTGSTKIFGNGLKIANEIRRRVKKEFNLTVSVGVSYNKIFAKLGSDYKKPDAVTLITPDNYKSIVWQLPVENLLFVGKSTQSKLNRMGIYTIEQLAETSKNFLISVFGKNGALLHDYANGLDNSPVKKISEADTIKSIGNSTTTPRDMKNESDVNLIFNLLSEQVCKRLREHHLKGSVIQIYLRDTSLFSFERQMKLNYPTDISGEVCKAAMELLRKNYNFNQPLRSVGIRVSELSDADAPVQLTFFGIKNEEKMRKLELTKDAINNKYGKYALCRAVILSDKTLFPEYDPAFITSSFNYSVISFLCE